MPAPMPIGFNFRDTLGYATDVAPDVFAGVSRAYVADPGWGWTSTVGGITGYDRGATGAPAKLKGMVALVNAASTSWSRPTFRVDVSNGTYQVRLAIGDGQNDYPYSQIDVYDGAGTTPLLTVIGARALGGAVGGYYDATGVNRSGFADWVANNAAVLLTVTSGYLRVEVGDTAGNGGFAALAHLSLASIGAPPTITDEPDSIEVTQPATATFSATLGGGTYTGLRWQTRPNSSGSITDISGANTTSYTTGATSLSMSGRQYRLVADWAGGVVYSTWATLTVNDGPAGVVSDVTGAATGGTTATVSFTAGTPAAISHTLELESPSGAGNWAAPTSTLAGSVFSATGLTGATEYRPRVRATNGAGSSAWVLGAAFTTDNVGTGGAEIGGGDTPTPPPGNSARRLTLAETLRGVA